VTDHLSDSQISRYVERKGDADEILDAAQHLDQCWECRDRTAAMVDDGAGDRPHRAGAHDDARLRTGDDESRFRVLPWAILITIAIAAIVIAIRVSL
jgi:hypothetical protein